MPDDKLAHSAKFLDLIDTPEANENAIQSFMEAHSAYMPTPNSFSRGLHLKCVIAKFPIGDRTCDYAYLAKTSNEWELTLVELEDSGKRIFKPSSKDEAFTSEFNDAVAQIGVWRDFIDQHRAQVLQRLRPLLVPPQMASNKLSVRYLLIIGRSSELEMHERRRWRLTKLRADQDITVFTYDTVSRMVERGESKPKTVLRASSRGYIMQSAEAMPEGIFAYVGTQHLELSPAAERSLRDDGYDIDAWKGGRMLGFNERYPIPTDEECRVAIQEMIARMVEKGQPSE
jgi:hypothetical protein